MLEHVILYRAYYVFVIYLTLFILLIHVKPNKSELVRNSSAEVGGFLSYGIDGKRAVEAAGTGQSGTKAFAEPLQRCLRSWANPGLPAHPTTCSLGQGQWGPLLQCCYCTSASLKVCPYNPRIQGKSQQPNCKTFKMVALHIPFANSSVSSVIYHRRNAKASF